MTVASAVFRNANVRTLDPSRPRAQAIAIAGDRIVAVGSDADIGALTTAQTTVHDLDGATLLPGFYDSHNHMLLTGLSLDAVDLSGAASVADIVRRIGERAATAPPGQWVLSSARWHESQLAEQRFPHRLELDAVSAGYPVLLQRGGHNVVANSLALEQAGIARDVANPPAGTFVRDADGALSGHAIGAAAQMLRSKVPNPPEHVLHDVLQRIEHAYNAAGITSVIEPGLSPFQIRAYQSLQQPTVRASLMWRLNPGFDADSLQHAIAQLREGTVERDLHHPWARVMGIKLGVDGGVEAGFYREPYLFADDPASPRGKASMSQANLEAFCVEAARLGWQVGAHCVGDAAIDATLQAFEVANRSASILGKRWTLIHMMLAHADHWPRANAVGAVVTAQQSLVYSLAEGFLKYVGAKRTHDMEPLRMYLERSDQPVGGGSDSPVAPYQPLLGIWSSVTRQTHSAGVQGAEWRISAEDALRMYTQGSAYAAFEEHAKGTLEAGKLADMVVLERDPCDVPPDDIRDIRVLRTIVGGQTVFEA